MKSFLNKATLNRKFFVNRKVIVSKLARNAYGTAGNKYKATTFGIYSAYGCKKKKTPLTGTQVFSVYISSQMGYNITCSAT